MADTLRVKVHPNQLKEGRVGLWDRNPAHPNGEVFVAGEGEFEVGDTSEVRLAIAQKRIVEVRSRRAEREAEPESEIPGTGCACGGPSSPDAER